MTKELKSCDIMYNDYYKTLYIVFGEVIVRVSLNGVKYERYLSDFYTLSDDKLLNNITLISILYSKE